MTNIEFAEIVAYISAGCGKSITPASQVVYFDALGDLDVEMLRIAAKRVLCEHVWATFPSIAELRESAAESAVGIVKELSPGEAWDLAWGAVASIDPEVDGSKDRGLAGLPPSVIESINAFSLLSLCYGKDPVGVMRGQFMEIYRGIAARYRRDALYPKPVLDELKRIREARTEPATVNRIADHFKMPALEDQ